ncbi:MAG: thiamine-phosphate kinase [Bacteroidota bacterium]
MTKQPTALKEIGEFRLIDTLTQNFQCKQTSSVHGVGDDAAVIDAGDHYQLVTTDILLEGIHFDVAYCPLQHLGYKAVAVNVADIAAMNGMPTQITVSIGVSNRFSLEDLQALYQGIQAACESYCVDLVGGDTAPAATGLALSVTALGRVDKDKLCLRKGIQPNDILCVTGDLGGAYIGQQILAREKKVWEADKAMQPDLAPYQYMLQRQLRPEARTDIVHELHELPLVPTAMIDISDGLASELFQFHKSSQVGANIYEDKLPIDNRTFETAVALNLDPIMCALHGGEDYELLFTIRPQDLPKVEKHPDISFIGYATDTQALQLITKEGTAIPLKAQGWEQVMAGLS